MKVPCKNQSCRRGSAPYRRSDWTSRLWAMSNLGQFKTTRECARSRSWLSLEHGLNISWISELSGTPRSCALQRAPVRWTLTSEPTIGRSLRPCQSRNITGATNSTTFPVTSCSSFKSPHESNRRRTSWPRDTRNKELNSRGKTKPKHPSCLNQHKQV